MRISLIAAITALAACTEPAPPPIAPTPAPRVWFICDGVDAASVLVVEHSDQGVSVLDYSKPSGALVSRTTFSLGEPEGAAGSVYTSLLQDGAEAGGVRETNPGMLETPGAAYTPRIASVSLGERQISCRWLPRTRFFGVTGRRSIIVHEDADGDLIYTAYDFSAPAAAPIELSDNGVTTPFSLEVRGGDEVSDAGGMRFQFAGAEDHHYAISVSRDGYAGLGVSRGTNPISAEEVHAYQLGEAQ